MKPAILIALTLTALALAGCYSPQDYAAGDAVVLAARAEAQRQEMETQAQAQSRAVAVQAEATRQAVLASGQAELELERTRELQRQTLAEQARQQEAQHMARLADIEATSAQRLADQEALSKARLADIEAQSAQRLADVHAKEAEAIARGQAAWIRPVAEAFVVSVGALGLAAIAVVASLTVRRMGAAWALKTERQADTPLMLNYDRKALTAPIFLTLVHGIPTLVNANTGEVLPLNSTHHAPTAQLRYFAAQNIVALQAGGEHAPLVPPLEQLVEKGGPLPPAS